jgi:hypothetical protein
MPVRPQREVYQAPVLARFDNRSRAHYLGTVEAPDEKAAEAAAVEQFDLNEEQRKRLALRERAS